MGEVHTMTGMTNDADVGLPLVSVVITNYNYARFLKACLASVRRQTYPAIECIIVDDCSTDESKTVLDEIASVEPQVVIIRNPTNSGQMYSFYAGFAAGTGEFVLFLDADDLLFDNAIATHVFVHLSSRIHAGFTTCDLAQTLGNRIMTGTYLPETVCAQRPSDARLLRRIDRSMAGVWPGVAIVPDDIEARVTYLTVDPPDRNYYAATSGNCFRRDALGMFLDDKAPMDLRLCADAYIGEAVFLLTGAIAIDVPLFFYRIHGGNGYSKYPDLANRRRVDPAGHLATHKIANRAIAARLTGQAAYFLDHFSFQTYYTALKALLIYVKNATPDDLIAFTAFLDARLADNAETIKARLSDSEFACLPPRPSGTAFVPINRMQKFFAELFLTAGRVLRSSGLSEFGERLWRA